MQPLSQTFPVLSFIGVGVQLGGALMLISLFMMLRRFVLRRGYFGAWASAWGALAVAILALVVRYMIAPALLGHAIAEEHPLARLLYFVYQLAKGLGFVFFARGTLMYVSGSAAGLVATRGLWAFALLFAAASTIWSRTGLGEMVIWQSAIAVPTLGYCASALLWLPRPRRTAGSVATGTCFALVAALWLAYAGAFALAIGGYGGTARRYAAVVIAFNSYLDLLFNVLLGYAMVLILMEDAKRQVDDAQAELRLTHDQLRRAALFDPLTDSMNRRAFSEGVGLDMIKATFGTAVIADLDNLKTVNDSFGHAAGDRLLRRCVDVFRTTMRSYDKLYRWGGDEFLLIVPSAHAADVIARLRAAFDAADVVDVNGSGTAVRLAVSLGAADYASSEELATAIEDADRAMYAEKHRRKTEFSDDTGADVVSPPTSVPAVR